MNQKQVWNKIAPEWAEFKDEPSELIIEFLEEQEGKVLDLGSGSGRYLHKIKNGKMYLVDFSEKMIEFAKKKSKKEKIDAEFFVSGLDKLPFDENYFDAAISVASLHCIETAKEREKAVEELYRVLKPGAQAKISVWNKDTKRYKNSPKERFVGWREKGKRFYYLYNANEIYNLFEEKGFKFVEKYFPDRMITFIVEKSRH